MAFCLAMSHGRIDRLVMNYIHPNSLLEDRGTCHFESLERNAFNQGITNLLLKIFGTLIPIFKNFKLIHNTCMFLWGTCEFR